jgi:ankyrin repeat protein
MRLLVTELGADVNLATPEDAFFPLYVAAQNGDVAMVRCLGKEFGADIDKTTDHGATPLHVAAMEGHMAVMKCLVEELGADVTKLDSYGRSLLFMSIFNGNLQVVQSLVDELGANVNQSTHDGRTPLGLASAGKHMSIAAYLIKKGANPQASAPEFGTAADVSRKTGAPAEQTAYLEAKAHCTNPDCSGAGIKKCTGCKQARYCGQNCQLAHWPAHKAKCKQRSAANDEKK